jgi:hypothetical protein
MHTDIKRASLDLWKDGAAEEARRREKLNTFGKLELSSGES